MTSIAGTDSFGLKEKGIVVLGAGGGGIGTAACAALARNGARLLCVDRDEAEAEIIAKATGGIPLAADITDRLAMAKVFECAEAEFGSAMSGIVDIVGVATTGPLSSANDETIGRQFDIVFRHALLAVQIGAPLLARNGGGTVTFVGSISGSVSIAGQGLYGIAKAALHHLVHCAAQEFGPQGVRANAIAPGFVQTPRLLERVPAAVWERLAEANPLRRTATPEDIANAILFLISGLSSYVTSNVLTLDGGASHNVVFPGLEGLT